MISVTFISSGQRKRLKATAVPSLFSFSTKPSPSSVARQERYKRKTAQALESSFIDIENLGDEVVVTTDIKPKCVTKLIQDTDISDLKTDEATQCDILTDNKARLSIDILKGNPKMVQYYTGFDDYNHFMMFFNILGPAVSELGGCTVLSPKDQLFLTLLKLRQAKEDVELGFLFHIGETSVSTIITTWINFMYFQLKELNIWPEREIIDQSMPDNFKKLFKSTRVILDATEVPIHKPKNVNAQSSTFSSYKNKNTLKTMIGCTPRGVVSCVSDSYSGSTSDRQIIERSDLVSKESMFSKGDSIMADRGIMVQDLFATRDVKVNTPTMLKGKSQLEATEVIHDRRIASKRIHIERIIGLAKTFKILKKELPQSKVSLGSRIIYVCFVILNFRSSIVGADA